MAAEKAVKKTAIERKNSSTAPCRQNEDTRMGDLDRMLEDLQARSAAGASDVELMALAYRVQAEELRPLVESGDAGALLHALYFASHDDVPMPDWLGARLGRALNAYNGHEARTLDDAFGISRPKGYHARANRERWLKGPLIVSDAMTLHASGVPLGVAMFDALGDLHGISKTRASEYFYFHKNKLTSTYRLAEHIAGHLEIRPDLAQILASLRPLGSGKS